MLLAMQPLWYLAISWCITSGGKTTWKQVRGERVGKWVRSGLQVLVAYKPEYDLEREGGREANRLDSRAGWLLFGS